MRCWRERYSGPKRWVESVEGETEERWRSWASMAAPLAEGWGWRLAVKSADAMMGYLSLLEPVSGVQSNALEDVQCAVD